MKKLQLVIIAFFIISKLFAQEKPNIVFILADDMGYGDVSALNHRDSKVFTPNIDKLMQEGMTFTDAHTPTSVCTPTRYAILTGRYAWRSKLKESVLWQYDPPLIAKDRLTIADLLKQNGYFTAAVGKWHLGWDWPLVGGGVLHNTGDDEVHLTAEEKKKDGEIDFSKPIENGPITRGFNYYFGVGVPNFPPYCYIENNKTMGIPDMMKPKSMYGNPGYTNSGPMIKGWKLENIMLDITKKTTDIISEKAKESRTRPFFIYMALTAPHTPIAPADRFKGTSKAGLYGDYIQEVDWTVGEVMEAIQKAGISKNTLIIFTSDNGSPGRNGVGMEGPIYSDTTYGHYPSYIFRGIKADIWEGGHHVPFIVSWPGKIKENIISKTPICSVDFMATCASLVNTKLPDNAGEDSYSLTPLLFGHPKKYLRKSIVHNSIQGYFAIRQGDWKLIMNPGSGGWTFPKNEKEAVGLPPVQLYNMKESWKENDNLETKYPQKVAELKKLLKETIENGRSTYGTRQANVEDFIPATIEWMKR